MKKLSLRPYPGVVFVCKTVRQYQEQHKKLFRHEDHVLNDGAVRQGRMVGLTGAFKESPTYIVWATTPTYLAHELSHVVLDLFGMCGIDPREASGEPFCYLLSQLMLECEGLK